MKISSLIVLALLSSSLAALIAQLLIDLSTVNIVASCIVFVATLVISFYVKGTKAIQTHPLSTFSIFGFAMTTQVGALLVKSLEWESLTEQLRQPIETFATLFGYLIVALLAHTFYRLLQKDTSAKASLMSVLLEKAKLYQIPSSTVFWLIGWVGVIAVLGGRGDYINNKIWDGFKFLIYSPYLIFVYRNFKGEAHSKYLRELFFILAWTVLITSFGILIGSRAIIFTGIMIIILNLLLIGLRSNNFLQSNEVLKFSLFFVLALLIIEPVSNLATAIQITRKSNDKSIGNTLYVAQKPHLIEAFRARDLLNYQFNSYDEFYIKNPIFKRLVETKFHDNALYFASHISNKDKDDLTQQTNKFILGIFPQPFLDFLKIDVDKFSLRFSMGDYLAHLSSGVTIGGYKTGSIFAQGQAIMGLWFLLLYFTICIIIFNLIDLLCKPSTSVVVISPLAAILLWSFFISGITAESFHQMMLFILRGYFQCLFIYLLVFWLFRLLTGNKELTKSIK
jgi:hypothetical protein